MKLTDQEMKEAEALCKPFLEKMWPHSKDNLSFFKLGFSEGITAALSSDKLLARVRAEAKRDTFLEEVTYWIGEHRAYLESGMMWESELAMKNARRAGEKAKELGGACD